MEITIRPAQQNDCHRMMELIHELALYEKAPEQVVVRFDHFVESGFGEKPVWWALVAEVNGKVEGMALYYIRYSTWKGQRMYLEDLVVAENMRGHKIGSLLFDALLIEAKAKNFKGIELIQLFATTQHWVKKSVEAQRVRQRRVYFFASVLLRMMKQGIFNLAV